MGAAEVKTTTTTPSTISALTWPPNAAYSFDSPSRSAMRMSPQEKMPSKGIGVSRVTVTWMPRPSRVAQYSTRSGS